MKYQYMLKNCWWISCFCILQKHQKKGEVSPRCISASCSVRCAWAEVGLKKTSLEELGMHECNVFERGEEGLRNWSCQGE